MRKILLIPLLILSVSLTHLQLALATPKTKNPAPVANQAPIGDPKSIEENELGVAAVRAKKYVQAEEHFQRAIEIDPGNLTALNNLTTVYLTNGNYQAAIEVLKKYIELKPEDPGLYFRLGDAYFSSKRVVEAQKAYEMTYKLNPHFPGVHMRLGTIYSLNNEPKKAEEVLLVAAKDNPKDANLLGSLASIFIVNGKYQEAVGAVKRALQIKSTPQLYITLGTAYEALKDKPNAKIAFERAAQLDPKNEDLKKKLEMLE